MRDYKKIKAWELADDLAVNIYKLTMKFPDAEKFAMISQLRRAAYSVPANIAEVAGRETIKDYLRFLDIAKGSLNEVEYFLHLAYRLEYIQSSEYLKIGNNLTETAKVLTGLIKYIRNNH